MASVPARQPGTQVGRFTLEQLIGTGGMGEVYLANVLGPGKFSKRVVVKLLLPHLARDANFTDAFANEARLAGLVNHPNVATVFDFGLFGDSYFLCMEYVEGLDLATLLLYSPDLEPAVAARICADALRGLHAAHTLVHEGQPLPVVHRDVSPENILVSVSGNAKLTDFGVARATSLTSPATGGWVRGKLSYIAPEVFDGRDPTPASDLYAMGVVLYQMLTGARPFVASTDAALINRIVHESPPEIQSSDPLLVDLGVIARTAMSKSTKERFESAAAMVEALERVMAEHAVPLASPERVGAIVKRAVQAAEADGAREGPGGRTSARRPSSTARLPAVELTRRESGSPPRNSVGPRRLLGAALAAVAALLSSGLYFAGRSNSGRPIQTSGSPEEPRKGIVVAPPVVAEPLSNQPDASTVGLGEAQAPDPTKQEKPLERPKPMNSEQRRGVTRAPPQRFGEVVLLVTPWAQVRWKNRNLGMTPFEEPLRLPSGKQTLFLTNSELGVSRTVVVEVPERGSITRKVNLASP